MPRKSRPTERGTASTRDRPGAQPEERLEDVNLSSLDVLVSRDEQTSAFCLLHDWLTEGTEVEGQSLLPSCDGKRVRAGRRQALLMAGKSRPAGSGAAVAISEISACFVRGGLCSLPAWLQRDRPGAQAEERLEDVNLSSLDVLVSRDEQTSAFCLRHNWLTKGTEVEGQSRLPSCDGKRARAGRPRALLMPGKSRPAGSGSAVAISEISVSLGEGSAPGTRLQLVLQRKCLGVLARGEMAELDLSSLDILLSRQIVQEPQPEERMEDVNLSSLDVLVSRDGQSAAFCLLHDWLRVNNYGTLFLIRTTLVLFRGHEPPL
ncbi:uncharacterized protein RBU57_016783 [Macrochelys suwanniensis]